MSPQYKIIITFSSFQGLGGVANYYKILLPYLVDKQFSIKYFESGSVKGKGRFAHFISDQFRYRRLLKTNDIHLIHINPSLNFKSFVRDSLFILQAKKNGLPVLVFFRGWDELFAKYIASYFLSIFGYTFGKADAFIVLASEFKKKLRKWGVTGPIYLQTTTVDPDLLNGFNIEQKMLNLKANKLLRVLYLARIEKAKGIFETVDAVKCLVDKGLQIKLSIAGDGPALEKLQSYVQDLELPPGTIKFLGYVRGNDKAVAFSEHDLYCFPTYYGEGMPNSVLEALAFGMPVITCPVGGLVDIFQDGVMGAFVAPGDANAIADKFLAFTSDREALAKISKFNHKFAQEHLMAPKVVKNLLEIYRNTLEASTDGR
ncbi:glycosyltransferase family 4 protein [Desulfonatronovibrio magnus]|uniref:glycosyltransferase family 4 protein n=1 Tax=Desulfonatronovibrio magnus TaxID=698827 RepID=UPI0005EB94FA|nr:glycosyltransferase family 4 protein [Desulfonatronovibrio magnus]